MGTLDLIAEGLEIVITIAGALVVLCFVLAAAEALVELVSRIVSRTPDPEETIDFPPLQIVPVKPALTLLVRQDPDSDVLHPSVQVRGGVGPSAGSIRLELADEHERIRFSVCRPFPVEALNGELPLPAYAPPAGVSVEQALAWHWDLILDNGDDEPYRWREHPRAVEGVNAEAELECPIA